MTAVIGAYALGIDRTFLIDQPNYLDNFANAPTLDWLENLSPANGVLRSFVGVFTDEALWQIWAVILGVLFSPPTAVIVTVCVLNLLVAFAVLRLPGPDLALAIWILVPFGFAVTGLLQIRQGFAFAVLLYCAVRMNRPLLATLLAAMIHTTFALALPFAFIAWACGRKRTLALFLAFALAGVAASLGGFLFEMFGGRRLAVYDVNETEANSILYVLGGLLCCLPSLHRLMSVTAVDESPPLTRSLSSLSVIHVGVIAFTTFSYFVFPLGAGRIGYLTMLLLIPILPSMRRRDSISGTMVFGLLLVYLVYVTVKTFLEGTYDIFFIA